MARRSEKISDELGVADAIYGNGMIIQQKSPIDGSKSMVILSDEELMRIVQFRGLTIPPQTS